MRIYPTVKCTDAKASIAWLQAAFGFEPKAVHEGEGGVVAHAELAYGDHLIMLGQAGSGMDAPAPGTAVIYLSCDAVDPLLERATAAGGTAEYGPRDTDYGSREAAVRDADGNVWCFGTYEP